MECIEIRTFSPEMHQSASYSLVAPINISTVHKEVSPNDCSGRNYSVQYVSKRKFVFYYCPPQSATVAHCQFSCKFYLGKSAEDASFRTIDFYLYGLFVLNGPHNSHQWREAAVVDDGLSSLHDAKRSLSFSSRTRQIPK